MQLAPGTIIKSYTLEERIGRGASGEVWKASDGSKTAAIKFMNENLMRGASAEKHRQRLQREVDTLTQLQHPNIPTLYEYDLDAERPYIAMRYVGGDTYDKMIANGTMLQIGLQKRLDIARELAQALWTAHSKGIIHRDIKPANMTGVETPYLLDFSISLKAQDALMTMFQVGTAYYMDPVDPPDQLADIYSFALVVYEMLFGRHAIFGPEDHHAAMPEHTRFVAWERLEKGDWSKPSLVPREELPADLGKSDVKRMDDIFTKALGRRENRYTDVRTFVDDLRGAALGAPQPVKASAAPEIDRDAETILEDDDASPTAPAYTPPSRPVMQTPAAQVNVPLRKPNEDNFTILEVESEKDEVEQSGLVGRLRGLGKKIFK
jgi:eukaryotic-like serine/threonine-protein kinase